MKTLKKLLTGSVLAGIAVIGFIGFTTHQPNVLASYNAPVSAAALPSTTAQWVKITKSYSDFATAGLTNTITIYTLPANSVVSATVISPTTLFTGGLISAYSMTVGIATVADLSTGGSVLTIPTRPFPSALTVAGKTGTTDTVTATATSVTGLLNAATQGSVNIYLLLSQTQ